MSAYFDYKFKMHTLSPPYIDKKLDLKLYNTILKELSKCILSYFIILQSNLICYIRIFDTFSF